MSAAISMLYTTIALFAARYLRLPDLVLLLSGLVAVPVVKEIVVL
jgi:hypothetical protein